MRLVILVFLVNILPCFAAQITFVGPGNDWSDANNWSPPQVPGALDNATISGGFSVQMTALGNTGSPYFIASLDLLAGSNLAMQQSTVEVAGSVTGAFPSNLELIESTLQCAVFNVVPLKVEKLPTSGIRLNPSQLQVLGTLNLAETDTILGLGGPLAAGPGEVGPGYFGHLEADSLLLGGNLTIQSLYGFEPIPGQIFLIGTVNGTRTGTFANAPEGSLVLATDEVNLRISYVAGDGNDIGLYADVRVPTLHSWQIALLVCGLAAAALGIRRRVSQ